MPAVYTLVGPFQAWGCMCTCTCLAGIITWQLCGMYFSFGEAASVLMRPERRLRGLVAVELHAAACAAQLLRIRTCS